MVLFHFTFFFFFSGGGSWIFFGGFMIYTFPDFIVVFLLGID